MPGPKSIRKRSTFAAFRSSIEGLCVVEAAMRRALTSLSKGMKSGDADATASFLDISDRYMRVVDRCREHLKSDLQARTMYEDLRERLESGMSNDEVEATLEAHFERKGWGSLEDAKADLRRYLIDEEGLDPKSADEIVARGLPKRTARSRQLPVVHKMRKTYQTMEAELEEAADDLQEALSSSEEVLSGDAGAQATEGPGDGSE